MRRRGRQRLTLTNRLLLLAALIVVTTTVLLLVTSAVGVYEMASQQEAARQTAYRDIVVAELSGRLNGAYRVSRTTAEESALMADDAQAWRRVLSTSVVENAPYLEGLALIDRGGGVLASWPGAVGDHMLPPEALADASATVPPLIWRSEPGLPDGGVLWAVSPVPGRPQADRLLVGIIRIDFIADTLSDIAESSDVMITIVLDAEGNPISVGGDVARVSAATLLFTPDEDVASTGLVSVEATRTYRGYYADVTVPAGLGWRVAVVEPKEYALRQTWAALRPGALGWAVALVIALAASLAVVSRVTQPIAELERRARALASGAEFEPEAIEQRDEVGRLLEAFNSIARRVNRLSDIAELLARASDRSLVLEGVTSSIVHMLGHVDVDVLLLTEQGLLELVAAEGTLAGECGLRVTLEDAGWIASSISTGEPVLASGGEPDALLDRHGPAGPVSALSTPLRAGADVIGAVVVVRPGVGGFTSAETETVRSFGAQASVALQNSRLFDEERSSRREAEALRAIAERVASPAGIEVTLDEVGRMIADLLAFTRCRVVVGDRSAYGMPPAPDEDVARGWLDVVRVPDHAASKPAPVVLSIGASREADALLGREGARSALLVPLVTDEAVAGLLVLLSPEPTPALGVRRLELVTTAATQVSLALQNAYLYEQAKSRADNLETIFRISHAVGSSLQTRVVLNRVLDVVQKILSADAVMLMTYDAQRRIMSVPMARGILHRDMLEATFRPGEDVPGRVFETREPERFDRVSRVDTKLLNAAAGQGLESLLVVPLLARGRSIGVLAVFARAEAVFSAEDLDLLRTFASQAALAIDTAEMFSREHQVASVLKESIQPTRLPRVQGIDAAQVYLPAGSEADIGGDYYDLFLAPDGRVVAAIGDVCGKGVVAATKTSMIKYSVRGMVATGASPSRILQELNRMLAETGDASNIVTLWLGYVDLGRRQVLYANGGHPPGLLLRAANGAIERLSTTGALLGAVPNADWTEHVVTVSLGDTLLLYTDGVTEARAGTRFFGEGRVRRSLRMGGSAELVAQRLFALVQRFSAGELRDDAAILALVLANPGENGAHVSPGSTSGK